MDRERTRPVSGASSDDVAATGSAGDFSVAKISGLRYHPAVMRLAQPAAFAAFILLALLTTGCRTDEAGSGGSSALKWEDSAPRSQQPAAALAAVAEGDVKVTASGLQYEVLKVGTGATPGPTSQVKVHYHGTLPSGKVFDSSVERGSPATFPLNRVIPGWTEGLQLMREGAKYRFTIPSPLAYGTRGSPPLIGPDQTLIFEVELIQVLSP